MHIKFLGIGFSIGTILAAVLSFISHHSLIWILIHGFLSWIYVAYYVAIRYII